MEAVPRLPMLSFDLKISPDRPPVEFQRLKHYIRDYYNEDPETYSTEIRNLETLRAQAVHPVRDVTGCSILKQYFCQLNFLASRFPMGKDGIAAVNFTWQDTYSSMAISMGDIKFEIVAVLYNIGALHSQLGTADDRTTPEGLKLACTHFQCAAWAFQHLKDTYPQPSGIDLSPDIMQFMYQLCLAQAQECILEKSMVDNRKATINAKVAAQIVDFYHMALNALLQNSSDDASILDTVGSKVFKQWKRYVKFKAVYYTCVSLLYQGMQSEEQQKMGERVAYYQAAAEKLSDAVKFSKGVEPHNVIQDALIFTRDVVEGKRKSAKQENDFIYHEPVPDMDTLSAVKGATLVKGIPFDVNDKEISGPDIFARLVPMKAHEASSLYSEEKAKLLRHISGQIDSKDAELVGFVSCFQLDHVKAHLEPVVLPQEVVDRCAALNAQPDAIPNLIAAMDKLNDAYHDVDGMLKEIMQLIKEEETNEKEYQEIMGTRPPSIVATDLTREANKYMEAHKKAAESNETLHKAMTQHIENLRVLQLPLDEVQRQLPSLDHLKLHEDESLKEVLHLLGKVDEMKKQRTHLANQLRESICKDDITSLLITKAKEENLNAIFENELQKHDQHVNLIKANLSAQEKILAALTDAYAKYAPVRKATTEVVRQREMILSALVSSYDAYEDLIAKSAKGIEFYRKLETNLTKLLQRVKGTCKVQQEEREAILAKNVSAPSAAVPSAPQSQGGNTNATPKLKDYLAGRKDGYTPAGQPAAPSSYYGPGYKDGGQSWLPGVRPAPVGSEVTAPPVCSGVKVDYSAQAAITSQAPPTPNPSPYAAYAPAPTASAPYHPSYSYQQPSSYTPQSYYYSQNTLQNVQYPTDPADATQNTSTNQFTYKTPASPATSIYNPQSYQYGAPASDYSQYSRSQYPYSNSYDQPASQVSSQPFSTAGVAPSLANNLTTSAPSTSNPQTSPAHNKTSLPASNSNLPGTSPYQNHQGIYTQGSFSGYGGTYPTSSDQVQPSPLKEVAPGSYSQEYYGQYSSAAAGTAPALTATYNMYGAQQPSASSASAPTSYLSTPVSAPVYNLDSTKAPANFAASGLAHPANTSYAAGSVATTTMSYSAGVVPGSLALSYTSPSNYVAGSVLPSSFSANTNYAPTNVTTVSGTAAQPAVTTATVTNQPGYNLYSSVAGSTPEMQAYMAQYSNAAGTQNTQAVSASDKTSAYNMYNTSTSQPAGTVGGSAYYSYSNYTYPASPGTQYQYNNQYANTNQNYVYSDSQGSTYPYYQTNPYGYQYNGSIASTGQATVATTQPPNATPATVTAGTAGPVAAPAPNTKEDPSSNVDLLAGLDFTVTDLPLQPQPQPSTPTKEKSEKPIETHLSSLNLGSKSDAPLQPPKQDPIQTSPIKIKSESSSSTSSPAKKLSASGKDPFSDTEVLNQFVQEVEKFDKFVEGLTSKTLNGPTPLDLKWNELQDLQDKDSHKLSISVARCYPMKNRFADILPYDNTRVELPSTKDDYINASYVKDLGAGCPNFIVTQAPLPSTYADFWAMVLEQQVEVIVCLLSDSQLNGEIYWANDKTEDLILGKIKVSLQSCNSRAHWIERIISVTDSKSTRVVVHLQFISWPNSWFPESPGPFLSLVSETASVWSESRSRGWVVLHCDAGVGRSGVFVVLTSTLADLPRPTAPYLPDLIPKAAAVALKRKNPLRDRDHLKFAYQCLLYHAQDILMKRGILASRSTFEEKRPKSKSHTRHPSQDFLNNSLKEPYSGDDRRASDASSTGSIKPSEPDPLAQLDPLWPIKRFSKDN